MTTNICKYCKKVFCAGEVRVKFCSTECRKLGFVAGKKQKDLEPEVDLTPYLTRGTIGTPQRHSSLNT